MNTLEKEKMIQVATRWVGYCEKERHDVAVYEQHTTGAGARNWTRFGRLFDLMLGFDQRRKDGYSWCAMFVAACLYESYGGHVDCSRPMGCLERDYGAFAYVCRVAAGGSSIQYHAGVQAWLNSYKVRGMVSSEAHRGDFVVYIDEGGNPYHIGIVTDVFYNPAGTKLFRTIEGNTSSIGEDIVANGGCVATKVRKFSKKVVFLKN